MTAVKKATFWPVDKMSFAEMQRMDLEHMQGIYRPIPIPGLPIPKGEEYTELTDDDLFDENNSIEIVAVFDDNTPEEVYDFAEQYVADIIANRKILESDDSGEDVSCNIGGY